MPVLSFFAIFAVSLVYALTICSREDKTFILILTSAGFALSLAKIYVIQQIPVWHDAPPDANTYVLIANSFSEHWKSSQFRDITARPYSAIAGTREWLFPAYLAVWQNISQDWHSWAIYSNAGLCAFFPAASYGIARSLGSSRRVGLLAGCISMLDPSSAINGAWLLKDTMVAWLSLATVWTVLRIIKEPTLSLILAMAALLGILATLRFVGFAAIGIGISLLIAVKLTNYKFRDALLLAFGAISSIVVFAVLVVFPEFEIGKTAATSAYLVSSVVSGQATIIADSSMSNLSSPHYDQAVNIWYENLMENPALALLYALARTLFSPNPLKLLSGNVEFRYGTDLYYISSMYWVTTLPGTIIGAISLFVRRETSFLFVALVIGVICFTYIGFFGEWSARQRIFMMPVFFAISAIGYVNLINALRRILRSSNSGTIEH